MIEEDRISSTVVGKIPSTTGLPTFKFKGTIRDNKVNLFMRSTLKSNEEVSDVEVAMEETTIGAPGFQSMPWPNNNG